MFPAVAGTTANVSGGAEGSDTTAASAPIAALDAGGGPELVLHHLLTDNGLEDEIAAQPDVRAAQCDRCEGLGDDAALHVRRTAAPEVAVRHLPAPRIAPGPVRGWTGRHHVDMTVEDQGLPAAGAAQDADRVLATGPHAEYVDVTSRRAIELGDRTADRPLPTYMVLVAFPGVVGGDARDAHNTGYGVEQLVSQFFEALEQPVGHYDPLAAGTISRA